MDPVDIDELLAEIMSQGRVVRVSDDEGRTYLLVRRFEDHQKIDPRWKTRCPACARQDSLAPVETPVSFTEPQRDSPELTLGREGMGRDGKKTPSSPATPSMEFDAFWAAYPRRIGKQAAVKAYAKALKLTSPQKILEGVAALTREHQGKDPKFIPHPSTWLNAGRWDDEVAPRHLFDPNNPANWK